MRNLTISTSNNLKGAKEFNHLRVTNLERFFDIYTNNLDYYKAPFSILADLEDKVKYENNPEEVILCAYKPDGDVVFRFAGIREEEKLRIVEYEFDTTIS
jgi:3'-phosphoadenosine 5'-phosphosulfate sulfotransferase